MDIRYRVEPGEAEQAELHSLVSGGRHAARKVKRAQSLLAAHDGVSDDDIAHAVRLADRPCIGLSGKEMALLVATACSNPPAGRKRWTLKSLAGEMVRLTGHQALSHQTVRRLAEDDLKPWQQEMWCIGAGPTFQAS